MVMAAAVVAGVLGVAENNDSVCFNSGSCRRDGAYCYACSDGNRNTCDNDGCDEL